MQAPADGHPARRVTLLDLFLGFGSVGLLGFGTALPWARWMLVEKRRWLSEEEMINVLALCQFLPGPNVCNISVCVGARFGGILGSVVALTGLMLAPIMIVLGLATIYASFGHLSAVQAAFRGAGAGPASWRERVAGAIIARRVGRHATLTTARETVPRETS